MGEGRHRTRLSGGGFHLLGKFVGLYSSAGLAAARARGLGGGCKPSLSPKAIHVARQMYAAGDSMVAEIAKVLGVSRATIYRHLPPR